MEIYKCISSGGKILFVSTKKQATETIASLAKDTSQYYVNHRWLGGTLTNFTTLFVIIFPYFRPRSGFLKYLYICTAG